MSGTFNKSTCTSSFQVGCEAAQHAQCRKIFHWVITDFGRDAVLTLPFCLSIELNNCMAVSASQARLAELVLMPTQWRPDGTHLIRKGLGITLMGSLQINTGSALVQQISIGSALGRSCIQK